jgi:predicted flap endonuclease-1-like 5' DNA nuclease
VFLIDESLKSVRKGLSDQTEMMKNVNANLTNTVDPQLSEIKEASARQLKEIGEALEQIQQRDKKTVSTLTQQLDETADIKLKLEKLESELTKPKPLLTSRSNVEDVKGIGPGKGTELKEIGITNAGELIMADPKLVAERMGSTEKTVEKLQGRAQLAMIPGLKEKDLFLLEELDILDRRTLAVQDPIDLSKKMNAIFKVNLAKGKVSEGDKPTIEEIDSWVKFVK